MRAIGVGVVAAGLLTISRQPARAGLLGDLIDSWIGGNYYALVCRGRYVKTLAQCSWGWREVGGRNEHIGRRLQIPVGCRLEEVQVPREADTACE